MFGAGGLTHLEGRMEDVRSIQKRRAGVVDYVECGGVSVAEEGDGSCFCGLGLLHVLTVHSWIQW